MRRKSQRQSIFLPALETEYSTDLARYEALRAEIVRQIDELLKNEHIILASPIESRVKTWASVVEKIQRNQVQPAKLAEIRDIAGLRVIALFRRDVERIQKIVEENFAVLHKEDTFTRLSENQFGYGSIHYEVEPPKDWLKVPTLKKLDGLRAEIQVRTGSQHIWAAASHMLQYKKEAHVPPPMRRAINRVAALLETVDLEFERVLVEREEYSQRIGEQKGDAPLDTESLKRLLAATFPDKNREEGEDYADLLDDLLHFEIRTTNQLTAILNKHLKAVLKDEETNVAESRSEIEGGKELIGTSKERTLRGVYFTHVGLARMALSKEFPEGLSEYQARKSQRFFKPTK